MATRLEVTKAIRERRKVSRSQRTEKTGVGVGDAETLARIVGYGRMGWGGGACVLEGVG